MKDEWILYDPFDNYKEVRRGRLGRPPTFLPPSNGPHPLFAKLPPKIWDVDKLLKAAEKFTLEPISPNGRAGRGM
jgi:hypothetical protein